MTSSASSPALGSRSRWPTCTATSSAPGTRASSVDGVVAAVVTYVARRSVLLRLRDQQRDQLRVGGRELERGELAPRDPAHLLAQLRRRLAETLQRKKVQLDPPIGVVVAWSSSSSAADRARRRRAPREARARGRRRASRPARTCRRETPRCPSRWTPFWPPGHQKPAVALDDAPRRRRSCVIRDGPAEAGTRGSSSPSGRPGIWDCARRRPSRRSPSAPG